MLAVLLAAVLVVGLAAVWLLWEIRSRLDALIDLDIQKLDASFRKPVNITETALRGEVIRLEQENARLYEELRTAQSAAPPARPRAETEPQP